MASFRDWLDLESTQVLRARGETAVSYTEKMLHEIPLVGIVNKHWDNLWKLPFNRITTDGKHVWVWPIEHLLTLITFERNGAPRHIS
jgi:hypothetical protein